MKYLFLCGSLEPGNDGVGDYIARLSEELVLKAVEVGIIAINDKYIKKRCESFLYAANYDKKICILRIPQRASTVVKITVAYKWIEKFKPNLISLQFVNFSFSKYGCPFYIFVLFKLIGKKFTNHIMFHELWCGMGPHSNSKEKILGALQRWYLILFTKFIRFEIAFTSIAKYKKDLSCIGVEANIVPVFGNISPVEMCDDEAWSSFAVRHNLDCLLSKGGNYLVLGLFGTIYHLEGFSDILAAAKQGAFSLNRKLVLVTFGINRGFSTEKISKDLDILVVNLGKLSQSLVNRVMELVNLAIVTSPSDSLGKSGTAVSWLERGIPLLVSKFDKTFALSMCNENIYRVTSMSDILSSFDAFGKKKISNNLKVAVNAYLGVPIS